MIKNKDKYNYFIDTTFLQCPWPLIELKKLIKKLQGKKILLKIKYKEFLIDIKAFFSNNKRIKILYYWKKKDNFYIIINITEKET